MTFGLIQYVAGRRHLAGRTHAAQSALAPDTMRRAAGDILPETSGMSAPIKRAPVAFEST